MNALELADWLIAFTEDNADYDEKWIKKSAIILCKQHAEIEALKAFPKTSSYDENNGMDLRDYFAAKALVGKEFQTKPYNTTKSIAEECYAMADAMMKARGK